MKQVIMRKGCIKYNYQLFTNVWTISLMLHTDCCLYVMGFSSDAFPEFIEYDH